MERTSVLKTKIPVKWNIVLRPAKPMDARRIATLSGELGYPATQNEIVGRLKTIGGDSSQSVTVAEVEQRVVGWIHVMRLMHLESKRFAEIVGLVVDEKHRGSGIGTMLVEAAEKWAARQGCRSLVVRSNVVRKETHRFYEQLGYPLLKKQMVFRKSFH